jgi:hypothetical protein
MFGLDIEKASPISSGLYSSHCRSQGFSSPLQIRQAGKGGATVSISSVRVPHIARFALW